MDQLILHHGTFLGFASIISLITVGLTMMWALRMHANASSRIPQDPLAGTRYAKDFRG